jgi:molybdenum-dependent DNA-binding transcriptional regulator ModE
MSYRRAWLLVASLNSYFQEPVTRATTGGKGEVATASVGAEMMHPTWHAKTYVWGVLKATVISHVTPAI